MPNPNSQERPHYDTRTVHLPDGGRIIVAHKPGALDHLTDQQIVEQSDALLNDPGIELDTSSTTTDPTEGPADELAAARARKHAGRLDEHQPGEPFHPSEIAPYLNDPSDTAMAGLLADAINRFQDRIAERQPPDA